jgi:hypothetical protein
MADCKHDWHFVQGLTERLRCLRCGVMTWPKSVEERTQEMLADVLTIGSAWSKDGERIDPASVFKDHGALHSCSYHCDRAECIKAQRDELRDRLAQPEQEPVALVIDGVLVKSELPEKYTGHLYTAPPQRTEPLTDEDWQAIADTTGQIIWSTLKQAIEAKLKEKNGG